MFQTVKETGQMIRGMQPCLKPGKFHFCTVGDDTLIQRAIPLALASFREDEGMSFILSEVALRNLGLTCDMPMRQITLQIYSALDGVGLTAATSSALAAEDIPCNMVSAYLHDHAFVPDEMAEKALSVLQALASGNDA